MSENRTKGSTRQLDLGLAWSEAEVLRTLRRAGARRLDRIVFRSNRSTIWSLTQGGRVLNLHEGYRRAPSDVIRAFAVIARYASRPNAPYREACRTVQTWPGIDAALRRLRQARTRRSQATPLVRCQGTAEEQLRMRKLYDRLNRTRFKDRLPKDIPLRISRRMRSRLGHMAPEGSRRRPVVAEIALNRTLFRRGNEEVLRETLLHEMAHVAAYLFDGESGHGEAWRAWAVRAGCEPAPCISLPVRSGRR